MRRAKVLFASSVILAFTACGKKEVEKIPLPVHVQEVQASDIHPVLRFSGGIRPQTEVDLAFKQGGYVDSLHKVRGLNGKLRDVQVGDSVPAGTSLAQLRISDFHASLVQATGQEDSARFQVESSKADLDQANASQKKAEADFQRAQALYDAKAMTRADYDAAVSNHTSAIAQVKSAADGIKGREGQLAAAKGQTQTAQIALRDSRLIVPGPSLVTAKKVERGALVSSGTVGFTVADARTAKVAFGVPDADLSQLKMGAPVRVEVDALRGREFTGRITQISSSADRDSRIFAVEVSLPNADHALKVGMIATVQIQQSGDTQRVPMVPATALITSQSGSTNYSAFVVQDVDGKQVAKLKSLRIGEVVGDQVTVNDGLVPGDKIIVNLTNQLSDGAVVRVIN